MKSHKFVNPHIQDLKRSPLNFFLWKTGYYKGNPEQRFPPKGFCYPISPKPLMEKAPKAFWVGHSTYLIEIDGTYILTDPVWGKYCAPFPIKALKRNRPPPLKLKDLPKIDFVLVSHNHYDHLDAATVFFLKKNQPEIYWIVPKGLSRWFLKRSISKVKELSWWESFKIGKSRVTAVPAQHFSGRFFWDYNRSHWGGFVVENGGKKLYFCGDTGYNEVDFKEIGKKFGPIDLSMIPIGTYIPKNFMSPVHVSPFEAVKIHKDVGSLLSLGMHWNTFRLSEESFERPPYDLYLAMKKEGLALETFLPIDIGTYVNF